MVGAKSRDRLRIGPPRPPRLICFHAPKKVANGLADGFNDVRSRWRGDFGSKKDWPHFRPPPIAVMAIQASGRARTASSRHTSFSKHWLANRPENPHSSQ